MLADDIQAAVGGQYDRMTRGGVARFATEVAAAQRFALASSAAGAMGQIARSKPSCIVKAIEVARPSFKTMWIEWAVQECGDPRGEVEKATATRMGALLQSSNEACTRFTCTFAWITADARIVSVCPVGLDVDLLGRGTSDIPGFDPKHPASAYAGDPVERQAVEQLFRHGPLAFSPFMQGFANYCFETMPETQVRDRLRFWLDLAKDMSVRVYAAMCIINSRNLVECKSGDLARLNSARRRSGNRTLLDYSEVTISLSKRDRAAAKSHAVSSTDLRRHIVRGHFKVRKGGIFWWRPCIRGSAAAGTVVRTGYVVGGRQTITEATP